MVIILTNILSVMSVVNWIAFNAPLRLPLRRVSVPDEPRDPGRGTRAASGGTGGTQVAVARVIHRRTVRPRCTACADSL
jgi:hypothetical protein